jgi:hypothetical protein
MKRTFGWYFNRAKSYVGRPRTVIQVRPVPVDQMERCESPLFIVGAHRSGTSLVRRIFNSHPEIACPPESFFMANYVEMLESDLIRGGYFGLGCDAEAMRADLARKASELHEAFRIAHGKKLWADKTPQYTAILDGIDRLFAAKPRYVLVLRHPCDVVYSNFRKGWTHNDIADPFESNLAYVKLCIERLLAFESKHAARCTRLVYDQLARDPERTLRESLARIGLDYHPDMLEFGHKEHNFGVEDPVVRGKSAIDASEGAWRDWNRRQKARAEEVFGARIYETSYWVG